MANWLADREVLEVLHGENLTVEGVVRDLIPDEIVEGIALGKGLFAVLETTPVGDSVRDHAQIGVTLKLEARHVDDAELGTTVERRISRARRKVRQINLHLHDLTFEVIEDTALNGSLEGRTSLLLRSDEHPSSTLTGDDGAPAFPTGTRLKIGDVRNQCHLPLPCHSSWRFGLKVLYLTKTLCQLLRVFCCLF